MGENKEKVSKEILGSYADFCLDCILVAKHPELTEKFPDYLDGNPVELTLKYQLEHAKDEKKKPAIKVEEVKVKEKKKKPAARRKTSQSSTQSEKRSLRANRFNGSYNENSLQLQVDASVTQLIEDVKLEEVKKLFNEPITHINGNVQKRVKGKIDEPKAGKSGVKKKIIKVNRNMFSDTSDDEKTETCKKDIKPRVPVQEPAVESQPQISILKDAFKNNRDFDEAMKKFSEKKKELDGKIVPPTIISPPRQDPSKRAPKKKVNKPNERKKSQENPNAHLGGIFTINNGWDKDEKPAALAEYKIPKKKRPNTPPKIVVNTANEDVMEAHEEFMYNGILNGGDMLSASASFSSTNSGEDLFSLDNTNGHTVDSENNVKELFKSKSSLNSSEDSDSLEFDDEMKKPPKKVQKLSFSDDEEEVEPSENFKRASNDDHEVLSLCADTSYIDELNEELEMLTEVDDTKVLANVVQKVTTEIEEEFEANTRKILQHIVDPETDTVLKNYFGNICPAVLENSCKLPMCNRAHTLLEEDVFRNSIINAPNNILQEVYQVAHRFWRLFQCYINVFVEISINNKDEIGLAELVKACGRFPRTISCYRNIVEVIGRMKYMPHHRAIAFIIQNSVTRSENYGIAREAILSLIIESGPFVVYFMDYIIDTHNQLPIQLADFAKILQICTSFQNPQLPYFCLNYLTQATPQQINSLNPEILKTFAQLNTYVLEVNSNRREKLLHLQQKMFQMPKW